MVNSAIGYTGEGGDILFFMLYPSQHFFFLRYLNYMHVCYSHRIVKGL